MEKTCPVCGNDVSVLDATCKSCGFKLHGSTQEFTPVLLGDEEPPVVKKVDEEIPASLTVLRGPQVGVSISLAGVEGPLSVGRSPRCEVFLNDMTVSRRHAIIERTPGGYKITDQSSFNGIWINNQNVASTILKNGDIIQIGAFVLRMDC